MARLRTHLAALAFGMSLALGGGPASALERFVLRLPFLEMEITINFADGESAEQLIQASPDLQDLELASGGKLLPLLRQVPYAAAPGDQGIAGGIDRSAAAGAGPPCGDAGCVSCGG